jgi:hypothetical protein
MKKYLILFISLILLSAQGQTASKKNYQSDILVPIEIGC